MARTSSTDSPGTVPAAPYSLLAIIGVAGLAILLWHTVLSSRVLETAVLDALRITAPEDDARLRPLIATAACGLLWALSALTAARLLLGARPADLGLGLGRLREHVWGYAGLLAVLALVALCAAQSASFLRFYPIYQGPADGLPIWFLLYGLQFVAVELFFRGFLLFPFAARLGDLAPVVGALPYFMTHFGKPLPEVIGSLPAGYVLGLLALRSRSIWGGAVVHIAVALTMEVWARP